MFAAKNELFTRPSGGGFVIPRSLRFRASASAYLNRTFGTPTSNTTWTLSLWLKRGRLPGGSTRNDIFSAGTEEIIFYQGTEVLYLRAGSISTAVFRDTSAWYHLVIVSNGTTVKGYINNSEVVSYTGTMTSFNSAAAHTIGQYQNNLAADGFFDGYMAEINFVDGQALTPTSFGATSTTTGVWSPIKYTGTYGNNGFHLDFNSYATQAALGTDTSGNSNTFTVNNCSVTAGVTYDSMIDVPTVTDTGSNYATLNGTIPTGTTYGQGNLFCTGNTQVGGYSSIAMTTGKFYAEVIFATGSNANMAGICNVTAASTDPTSAPSDVSGYGNVGYYALNGNKFINTTGTAYGASYTTGDIIGIEVDMDNNTVQFFKNGTSQGTISTTINTIPKVFWSGNRSPAAHSENWNFGQTAFNRTPTAGFVGLNTYNLSAASILKGNLYMDATTYTGTGASLGVTNAGGFQPDLVWVKSRSAATDHKLTDSVRGATKALISNSSAVESTDTQGLTAFNTGGFTVGTNTDYNNLAATYVGWQWKGGGAAVSNTSGTITSSVSASTASGFSVATFTPPASGVFTFGHGLGVAPSMVIFKDRSTAGLWAVYHASLPNTGAIFLNGTYAFSTGNYFNSTSPTSTVVTGNVGGVCTGSSPTLAYSFATIAGYSAFGSYVGNNSADGPFVYLGFRARWVMIKRTDAGTQAWWILDTATGTYNVMSLGLAANDSAAESSGNTWLDITANGFKIRQSGVGVNGSGATYIYAAFAESPFNNSLAR
jgi:hypothetical protein